MIINLLKLDYKLFKSSNSYSDFWSFYLVYISITIVAFVIEEGAFIPHLKEVFISSAFVVGIFVFSYSLLSSAYSNPLNSNSASYSSSITLENSLPIGRKNYIKGKIIYFITVGILMVTLKLPSLIAILLLKHRGYFQTLTTGDIIQFYFTTIASIAISAIFIYLTKLIIHTKKNVSINIKTKSKSRILSITLLILVLLTLLMPGFIFMPIALALLLISLISKALPFVALLTLIQFVWILKNINQIDFNYLQ